MAVVGPVPLIAHAGGADELLIAGSAVVLFVAIRSIRNQTRKRLPEEPAGPNDSPDGTRA